MKINTIGDIKFLYAYYRLSGASNNAINTFDTDVQFLRFLMHCLYHLYPKEIPGAGDVIIYKLKKDNVVK